MKTTSSGKAAHKSINKLITAIQAGTDVKIVVMDSAQGGGISTKCDNVIWKTNYVACVDTSQISIKPVSGGATGFHDNPYNVYTLFDTKGRIERSRWLIGDHVSKGHNVQKSAIKWFVEAN